MFIVVRKINNQIITDHLPVDRRGLHWFSLNKELISRDLEAVITLHCDKSGALYKA